ncbi:tyrosine-type recombinase/integrase [Flavobacterium sp. DSR2-3-3]|uniref:tyrosine-type recombinase/integrase n=1 Tax=Flavobacterium sp. DSR2-3-3 TaxID=2804632 RepID=UPI003CEC9378
MSKLLLLLLAVHDTVHDLPMKTNYSEPKIFTGKVDVSKWNKLSKQEQNEAISKEWYVYFSFRNPQTGKLERQTNVKLEANRIKTAKERSEYLKTVQQNLSILLKKGYNPYQDNTKLNNKYFNKVDIVHKSETLNPKKEIAQVSTSIIVEKEKTIGEAFEFGLKNKINVLGKASYSNYQGRIKRFLAWLDNNEIKSSSGISTLNKKILNEYLNFILETSRATNRNNTRADLSSLIQVLVDNELMSTNFVKSISILKATPERNKTYSVKQESDILNYLKVNDPIVLLYTQFIIYNLLRPIEVNRLKIDDLDLEGKKLFVKAKNKAVKVKIIPQKIIDLLPDFSQMNKNHYLFTPTIIGGEWEAEENNRRDYFSKRFKVVKDHFGLNDDYGLYSFRHTSITNLYKEFIKTLTPNETKSKLMEITGHQTMQALEKYLRDIDAALPEDYSHLLK